MSDSEYDALASRADSGMGWRARSRPSGPKHEATEDTKTHEEPGVAASPPSRSNPAWSSAIVGDHLAQPFVRLRALRAFVLQLTRTDHRRRLGLQTSTVGSIV